MLSGKSPMINAKVPIMPRQNRPDYSTLNEAIAIAPGSGGLRRRQGEEENQDGRSQPHPHHLEPSDYRS
jgi:hypothetical protein